MLLFVSSVALAAQVFVDTAVFTRCDAAPAGVVTFGPTPWPRWRSR